ncbi:methyltransferase domain-containing protein [Myxococcus sp. CA056]|uniref:CheR family methyltransferase n=1 Tax=unclassified Myxococcus TaxID=2648731 RepID=UPI00157A476E|nr:MULTISPECIES: CheR family methyltransferase [unclassified Myxococcus]NTX15798.1 methyltransferase domain-containing protein [Myxococcus sp. CA056]NTX38425.1 methyltransferase domain-containing protein [Myxococcus sp. CA033]NTX53701.1 methyltransferase domain-containing protein [Myxococcus sp. CA039A]
MSAELDPRLLTRAREVVSSITGFRDDAIANEAMERVVRGELARGRSSADLLGEMLFPQSTLSGTLVRAALVGETYFFRQPEHFRYLSQVGVPAALRRGSLALRGWSAGCATGEEAYSLAAALQASVPHGFPVEVLGTDLHEASLETARRASYGTWSRRESAPRLFPLYLDGVDRQVTILPVVRRITSFAQSNLLAPLPERFGRFDFIFCRNVLTYFSLSAREAAIALLARALNPGGLLFLGAVEADRVPAGMVREGTPELQTFRLLGPGESASPTPVPRFVERAAPPAPLIRRPMATPAPVRAQVTPPPPPARLHLEALERIEGGDVDGASAVLESLVRQAPDYLPGLLELALLRERSGAREAAVPLMRALRMRAERLPPDQLVDGPEALPARFYQASADAYLNLGALE